VRSFGGFEPSGELSTGMFGRVFPLAAATRESHQPGRSTVEALNPVSDPLRREERYGLLSGANDVEKTASG